MQLINIEDDLYLVKRQINSSYFKDSKDPKKLIGLWADHLECSRVIDKQDQYWFLQKIEEAIEG